MKNLSMIALIASAVAGCSFWTPPESMNEEPETDPTMEEGMSDPALEPENDPMLPQSCMSGDTRYERCRSDCPSGESYLGCTGSGTVSYSWQCLCEPLEQPAEEPESDHACDPGTVRHGDCAPECEEGSSFRVCIATGEDFAWQCVVHNPERCAGTEGSDPEPTDPPPSCTPTTEVCGNGVDEDCDGLDPSCPPTSACDGDPLIGASCHDGLGECRRDGHFICDESSGTRECSVSAALAATETCDGLDNDCDGSTDEGDVCSPGTRRLRIEMRVTDTSTATWGVTRDHGLVNDDGFAALTCRNTGSTAMQSIGSGWYRCEVDVPTDELMFVGRFRSDQPEHSGWIHSSSDWGASSCYGTDGVTVRVFDSGGTAISTSLGYGAAGGCRHVVP